MKTPSAALPISLSERLDVVDVLRGLAVAGILIGNLQWFSGYGMMPDSMREAWPAWDKASHFMVHFFVEGKFYSIFSFLFGFGFALQMSRAEDRGDHKASVFKRRLFWLLIIGAMHGFLLWAGDILMLYALMGFVLLLFRKKSQTSLLNWSVCLMVVPIITYSLIYLIFRMFVSPEAVAGFEAGQVDLWNTIYAQVTGSNYVQNIRTYNLQYMAGRWAGLIIEMRLPKVLAMFLLGMYAYRRGIFQDLRANSGFLRRVLLWSGVIGIVGNILFAWLAGDEAPMPPTALKIVGVAAYAFGVPALAIFIISVVAYLWQADVPRRMLSVIAPVGRMALSNYIFQTASCVTIFYGYGFGNFGRFGPAAATLIALTIFVVQIILSNIWLHFAAYGPLEWIWRQLTYRRRLPLLKTAG